MTKDQATRTQVDLAERGVEFVHVSATDTQRVKAELAFVKALPAFVFSPARKSRFLRAQFGGVSCEHVGYLFIEDVGGIHFEILKEVKLIAGTSPASKRQPVTYYVE